PMGSDSSGTYQMQVLLGLRARCHRVTVVTPGTEVASSLDILRELAPRFGQTIIHGAPGVIRDILTRAAKRRIRLAPLRLGLLVGGESISEDWRNEIGEMIGAEPAERIRGFYGPPETGVIAVETRATIVLRRAAERHPRLRKELFGEPDAPAPTL